ncbi:MAG TPA: S9 family peptidase [Gaiellaceae bacterium]|nr:S9 family peptidase [Gaiellaceae bacterium]
MKERAPYGSWPSPIGIDLITSGQVRAFAGVWLLGDRVAWLETRPDERGRMALVAAGADGEPFDLVPPGFNVRTRVHEYGGGACWFQGATAFCSNFDDSRLYRLDPGTEPRAITPEPSEEQGLRYADGVVTPDGATIVCVRERHESAEVVNELVALPVDGSGDVRVIVSGRDFYSTPRLAPDGRTLAWLQWNHPNMPWDGTELWVGELGHEGVTGARMVAGGADESIFQPEWSPAGVLHFASDRTGWWNLCALDDGGARAIAPVEGDVGLPQWSFGMRSYAFLGDGRIARKVCERAVDRLELVDPASGSVEPVRGPWTEFGSASFDTRGEELAFAAGGPREPYAVVVLDTRTGDRRVVRRAFELELDLDAFSEPRAIELPTRDGGTAHAFYYPPLSATHAGPEDELPPLRVICHGGPTAQTGSGLELSYQFWTSRGIGVVDVNYRGSTGYGRPYRDALRGRWGEIDVTDCIDAAAFLAEQGEVDPARIWVEGGSAGGFVVLAALSMYPGVIGAGVSHFGVADMKAFAETTHKFESRYLDTLIGPYPEEADLYRERSPVHHADAIDRPLLLLQGLDDRVVPPSQAELMVEALERKGVPYAYLTFEGEGHGFRRSDSQRRALEAVVSFVGQVFGFEPADELQPLEVANLPTK